MTRFALVALTVLSVVMTTGCSTMTKDKSSKKDKDSTWAKMQFWKKGYQQPVKMAVLWSHDVLTVAGQPPTRGFGGRIYFYNNKSQTIPVEGELVVHGFDDSLRKSTGASDNQPDKRFRFTEEQFTEHFSESDLGASYSVWIPWDGADGVQKEITLIPTFLSSKGEVVQGAAAKVVLPGRTSPVSTGKSPIQTVVYEEKSIPTAEGPLPQLGAVNPQQSGGMKTTTIQVPGNLMRPRVSSASIEKANAILQSQAAQLPSNNQPTAWEQARAQALADAFKPAEPVPQRPMQPAPNWQTNTVPSASNLVTNNNFIAPPSFVMPSNRPAVPANNTLQGHTYSPAKADASADLPPGFQLSPPATAW